MKEPCLCTVGGGSFVPDGPGVPCSAPPLCPECTMPPLKSGMFKHDVGLGRQMAGSLLFPPQITVWDSFLGLHLGLLLLFHPPAPLSIYLSTYKYLSYQLISINLPLSKLAQLISIKLIFAKPTSMNWSTFVKFISIKLASVSLTSALCVAGWRLVRAWTPQPPLRFAWQVRRLVTFSCVVSNWRLVNLPLSSFLRQNYLHPTYLYQTYFCQTFSLSPSQTCLYQI